VQHHTFGVLVLRRPVVSGTILAVLAGLLGVLFAASPATATTGSICKPGKASAEVPVCIGTYNIRSNTSLAEFEQAADSFKERVDVGGLQEIGANVKNKYLLSDWTWGYYRPEELQQNPVIWDTKVFDLVDAHGYLLAKGRDVHGEKPSNTDFRKDSYATVVRLQHIVSGQQISVINVHLVSGAVKAGLPWPDRPLLYQLYTEQVANLVKLQAIEREASDQVFVLGDFNVGYKADRKQHLAVLPYKQLTKRGLISMWRDYDVDHGGTHEDAYIDQVWSTEAVDKAEVATDIKHGDHLPVIATYGLPVLPGFPGLPGPALHLLGSWRA
jgi:endonuclease/exonuclease/phosphatase family metal-dependent hydrolase